MAKAFALRLAGLVICGEWVSQFRSKTLKSPRTKISEHGDGRVILPIVLDRWSNRTSWLVELGER